MRSRLRLPQKQQMSLFRTLLKRKGRLRREWCSSTRFSQQDSQMLCLHSGIASSLPRNSFDLDRDRREYVCKACIWRQFVLTLYFGSVSKFVIGK
jgi:hypothetical protein